MNDEERDLWGRAICADMRAGVAHDYAIRHADKVIEALRERTTPPAPQDQTATPARADDHVENTRRLLEDAMFGQLAACEVALDFAGREDVAKSVKDLLNRVRRYRDGPGSV